MAGAEAGCGGRAVFLLISSSVGAEANCRVTFGRKTADGKALLETDELIFRGDDLRLSIPYRNILRVDAKDGTLRVTSTAGIAAFDLGDAAAKWAEKIRNPPSRIEKLGIKTGQRVLFVGLRDASLREEIETRGATVLFRGAEESGTPRLAAEGPEVRRRDLGDQAEGKPGHLGG